MQERQGWMRLRVMLGFADVASWLSMDVVVASEMG